MNLKDQVSLWVTDNIPAPVRHFVAAFVGAFILFVSQGFQADGTPAWGYGAKEAFIAAVGTLGILAITPLTDAYGTGKKAGELVEEATIEAVVEIALEDALPVDDDPEEAVADGPNTAEGLS